MKKIIINIPDVKLGIRPLFDRLLKSLTYEVDETGEQLNPPDPTKQPKVQTKAKEATDLPKKNKQPGNKIQLQKDDLPLISAALIRYKKHLLQNNQPDKAQRVGELDQVFYSIIAQKGEKEANNEPVNLSERFKQNKREQVAWVG